MVPFGNNPALPGIQNTYTAQLQSRLVSVDAFNKIILKSNTSGALVRLGDVARVELGTENYSQSCRYNGRNASAITIYQVSGQQCPRPGCECPENNGGTKTKFSGRHGLYLFTGHDPGSECGH